METLICPTRLLDQIQKHVHTALHSHWHVVDAYMVASYWNE